MELHSKQLGAIGVLRVAAKLMSEGYSVFAELGDLSRVGLIVLVNHQPIKVQVKTRNLKDGRIVADSRKSGPGYRYRYTPEDVDVFAIYVSQQDLVLYVDVKQILNAKSTFAIRVLSPGTIRSSWFMDLKIISNSRKPSEVIRNLPERSSRG